MIAAIDFISRDAFLGIKAPTPDLAALSIGDIAECPPATLERFAAALRVEFLDCEAEDVETHGIPEEALCTPDLMASMLAFIERLHAEPARWRLVIHCRMGVSRSAAVALAAHAAVGAVFPRHADAHFANRHVVALASQALGRPIEIPQKTQGDEPHPYLSPAMQI